MSVSPSRARTARRGTTILRPNRTVGISPRFAHSYALDLEIPRATATSSMVNVSRPAGAAGRSRNGCCSYSVSRVSMHPNGAFDPLARDKSPERKLVRWINDADAVAGVGSSSCNRFDEGMTSIVSSMRPGCAPGIAPETTPDVRLDVFSDRAGANCPRFELRISDVQAA